MKKKLTKTPVFFIATKVKEQPALVNFYTWEGKEVDPKMVERVRTNVAGTQLFVPLSGSAG